MSPTCFPPSTGCPSDSYSPSTYGSEPSPYYSYGEYQPPEVYSYPSSPYGSPQQPYYHASKSRTMPSVAEDSPAKELKSSPSLDSCIRRYPDTRLVCALPFERRTPTNEKECKKNCLNVGPRCRSFQYDPAGNVCDLFEHSLAPSTSSGQTTLKPPPSSPSDPFAALDDWDNKKSKKHSLTVKMLSATKSKISRGREKRFSLHNGVPLDEHSQSLAYGANLDERNSGLMAPISGGNDLSSSTSHCVPILERKVGVVFTGLEPGCESVGLDEGEYEGEEEIGEQKDGYEQQLLEDLEDLKPKASPPPLTTKAATNLQKQELEPMTTTSVGKSRKEQTTQDKSKNRGDIQEDASLTKTKDCQEGHKAYIQLIDGISLIGQLPLLLAVQLESADICLQVCRQNKNLDGFVLSNSCRSATFHRQSGRCELLNDSISPNGPLQYIPNPDSLYFEKLCIPKSDLISNCEDVIHRIPQHYLDSRKKQSDGAAVNAQNQLECIRQCIGAKALNVPQQVTSSTGKAIIAS
uniref:Apple domain-containing protein n=1 Tax=Meloidogyne javanica TaxID=6303 RepID=A0A915N0T3_MELJA